MSSRVPRAALLLIGLACLPGLSCARAEPGAARGVPSSGWPCAHCDVQVGAGTTFLPWQWTDGVVTPLLIEIDGSRFELGAFHFATRQYLKSSILPPSTVSAQPYWGLSAMRRWQILHRSWLKLYLGLGIAYRSRTDLLEGSRWNLAYLLATRFSLGRRMFLELGARHWSDAWTRMPNRGQNMVLVTIGFR